MPHITHYYHIHITTIVIATLYIPYITPHCYINITTMPRHYAIPLIRYMYFINIIMYYYLILAITIIAY